MCDVFFGTSMENSTWTGYILEPFASKFLDDTSAAKHIHTAPRSATGCIFWMQKPVWNKNRLRSPGISSKNRRRSTKTDKANKKV